MDLLQEDLDRVVNNWNSHTIRATRSAECPHGKPNILYLLPGENGKGALHDLWFKTVTTCFFRNLKWMLSPWDLNNRFVWGFVRQRMSSIFRYSWLQMHCFRRRDNLGAVNVYASNKQNRTRRSGWWLSKNFTTWRTEAANQLGRGYSNLLPPARFIVDYEHYNLQKFYRPFRVNDLSH